MKRYAIFILSLICLIASILSIVFFQTGYVIFAITLFLSIIGVLNLFSSHNVLRNYPIIGQLRYIFEFIRPEIQQYFVATNTSGRPYSREMRSLVYQRAKNVLDAHPFGTEHDIVNQSYLFAQHSLAVKQVPKDAARINVGGPQCQQPYLASRINISAMSFGALSSRAILALNRGAKLAQISHNTGEGGLSDYHLKEGGDIVWQLGTAYFGTRTKDGHFDEKIFQQKANLDAVKMIEIKLSQGAKPSHGGLLPAAKITPEIARIRGIEMGKDCYSPPTHSAFSTPLELMHFIDKLRNLTHGKPIGFKICIGKRDEFMAICKAMLETGITPDFITVDGAEGGTGAAPPEYTNRLGMPGDEALAFVHNCLLGTNLRESIRIIASAKVTSGFDVVKKIALGADMCNIARPMLFAIGCIQSLRCHTNTCPTGVTTQNPSRARAINVNEKSLHVVNYHRNTIKSFLDITGAMGISHPDQLTPDLILYRLSQGESVSYRELFHSIQPGGLLSDSIDPFYKKDWEISRADRFNPNDS